MLVYFTKKGPATQGLFFEIQLVTECGVQIIPSMF